VLEYLDRVDPAAADRARQRYACFSPWEKDPATEMGMRGRINIGQLARDTWGDHAYLIGFGTDHGTVAAASNWDEPIQVMDVRPSHTESYEKIFHQVSEDRFLLPLRECGDEALQHELSSPRLERAIGVIYRPETERISHYFESVLPKQFDEYIWLDQTSAVQLLERRDIDALDEMHPLKTR